MKLLYDEKKIKDHIVSQCIGVAIIILLSMIGLFFTYETAYFSAVLIIVVSLIFLIVVSPLHFEFRMCRKICIAKDGITLYSVFNKRIREYRYIEYSHAFHKITFIYANVNSSVFDRTSECLVLYRNMELYEGMEYRDYWNDENILIIQNPEAIAEVEKYIS